MHNRKAKLAKKIINLQPIKSGAIGSSMQGFSTLKTKIATLAKNAIAVILRNQSNDRYHYGEFDNLPNTIIAAVNNSGTATACISRLDQFIQGDGFISEQLNKVKANSKQSLKDVLGEQSLNAAFLKGYALRLVFNVEGKIAKVYNLDINTLRKVGGKFEYNPLMGEVGKIENETRVIPEFDIDCDPAKRRAVIADQIKKYGEQVGEVLYVFKKGLGRYYDVYPVPDYYSAIEDIIADGKLSQLDLRNITQGFRTPVIISTGPIDDQNEDEDGNTAQDFFDQSLESFTGEDASPILHLKGATDEFKPTVTVINLAEILDQTDKTSERISKRVARNMGVPDVLIGIAHAGSLGNAQELKNQMSLFALTVFHLQAMISEGYNQIKPLLALQGIEFIPDIDFTISTLRPFEFIPDSVIANLTSAEQKEMFEIDLEASKLLQVEPVNFIQNLACPVATQDLELNTKNRNHAIQADYIKYGPLNVKQPEDYWQEIAEHWDTSEEAAKQSNCSNCAAFDISKRMLNCMPGNLSDDDGNLGYCHMHKFKCHSARSCYTWAAGGSITTDKTSTEWQERGLDVTALLKNQSYNDYPKKASENAQAALRWAEENGWGSCGTDVGKQRANQLAKGEFLSRQSIAKMAAFERHRGNSNKSLGDGCGRLMWLAWGGDAGVEWAQRKLKQIDKE